MCVLKNNKNEKTILVSGTSGIVGYGILKSLRAYNPHLRLIGTTIYDDSIADVFCDIFEKAPLTSDENYINWLCEIIKKHNVDMVIPGIEADMKAWNKAKEILQKTGAYVLLNNPELIELCSDKWNFYQKLKSSDSKLAIETRLSGSFEELKEKFGLPFLLKPRCGFGSKGIIKVENEEIFSQNEYNIGNILMVQPIVGNVEEEYTISGFFDAQSNLLCIMCLKRKLSKDGFTEKAEVAELGDSQTAIEELAKIFKPVGPTNFQFRVHNRELKLLEINPRISSSTSIRTAFGYNESEMSIEYFLNAKSPTQPAIKKGRAVRYTEDYIYYDKTSE